MLGPLALDFPYAVACYRGAAIEEAEGPVLGAPGAGPP